MDASDYDDDVCTLTVFPQQGNLINRDDTSVFKNEQECQCKSLRQCPGSRCSSYKI